MTKKISLSAATAVVIANMIGTGVFTSLGYQLLGIQDYFSLIILWLVGGFIALLGAFCYSEIGASIPSSGGEYHFLSEIYHPSIGFLSGWVSMTIGFSAPIAAAASALTNYVATVYPFFEPKLFGIIIIIGISLVQSINYAVSSGFQIITTSLKVILTAVFIIIGFSLKPDQVVSFFPSSVSYSQIFSAPFFISLVYVSFAYSGWNASSYIAGEIKNPQKNIPLSIVVGTAVVMILYVLLNAVFLYTSPISEMKGVKEVAFVVAKHIFDEKGGRLISIIISVLLISTISAMVFAGPRVIQRMSEDYPQFTFLAKRNSQGIPVYAIFFQGLVAILIYYTAAFDTIITYTTFILNLFSTLTVFGLIVLRIKRPNLERPYKTIGYPFTPLLFTAINLWFMYFILTQKTVESFIGLGIVALGLLLYFVVRKR